MGSTFQFCGNCGEAIPDGNMRFCGECGTPIQTTPSQEESKTRRVNPTIQPQTSASKQEASTSPPPKKDIPRESDSLFSRNAIISGYQTAVVWLIGWLPICFFISRFYDKKRAINPGFYANYPRTWDTTLFGLLSTYAIGSMVAGFLAGLIIYRIFNKKSLALNVWGALPAAGWLILWSGILWAMTLPIDFMDDGTLLITMPIFALIFGALVAKLSIWILAKQYDFIATPKQHKITAILWALCGVLSIVIALTVSEI